MIIVPALFLSAIAETAAIRGHITAKPVSVAEPPSEEASSEQLDGPASPEHTGQGPEEEPVMDISDQVKVWSPDPEGDGVKEFRPGADEEEEE